MRIVYSVSIYFFIVAINSREALALSNIDLLSSKPQSNQTEKSSFNLLNDSTREADQVKSQDLQNSITTHNKPESSRFFDSVSNNHTETDENLDMVGTWEGKCNISGINYYIRLSCLNGGICSGIISTLEGSDLFGFQGCDRLFTTSWKSHGTEISIPIPPAEGSNVTNYDMRGNPHMSHQSIGAESGILKFQLNSPESLVLQSDSGDCNTPLPIGLTPDYPDRLVLNKINKDQSVKNKFDLHTCYRNAAQFSSQAYKEKSDYDKLAKTNAAIKPCDTIRKPVGTTTNCIPDFNPIGNFWATIHKGDDGRYYLAFKGTDPNNLYDWYADYIQASGVTSSQYNQAIELAKYYQVALDPQREGKLIITGHSLGGGMALAAALKTFGYAITFNQASVNTLYSVGTRPQCVINYSINGDPIIKSAETLAKISSLGFYNLCIGDSSMLSTYGENVTLKPMLSMLDYALALSPFSKILSINKHFCNQFLEQPCNPDGSVQQSQILSERVEP